MHGVATASANPDNFDIGLTVSNRFFVPRSFFIFV
jgi:hypothetical protein